MRTCASSPGAPRQTPCASPLSPTISRGPSSRRTLIPQHTRRAPSRRAAGESWQRATPLACSLLPKSSACTASTSPEAATPHARPCCTFPTPLNWDTSTREPNSTRSATLPRNSILPCTWTARAWQAPSRHPATTSLSSTSPREPTPLPWEAPRPACSLAKPSW